MSINRPKNKSILGMLVLPLVIIYLEIVLAYKSNFDFSVYCVYGTIVSSISGGFLLGILCSLTKNKNLNSWICFVLTEIITIFFIIELFCNESYSSFMSIPSLVTGTEGVVTGFGDVVVDVIIQGLDRIFIFHIPALIILTLCIIKRLPMYQTDWLKSLILVCISAILFFGAYKIQTSKEILKDRYTYDYIFDDSVRSFGLGTSLYLDTKYMIIGVPQYPINPSEIETEPTSYPKNKLNIDWRELSADLSEESEEKEMLQYIMNSACSDKNKYTGLFEGKNLILITVESLSKELIREDFFPTLYRMANNGIVVEDYYHPFWGGSTTSGEFAILTGLIPTEGAKSMQNTLNCNNGYTIAPILKDMGYSTIAYHNGDSTYYNRIKTHPSLGFSKFYSYGSGMEDALTDTWPRSDLEMFTFIEEDLKNYDKFYAYIMTFSGHGLYNFTANEIGKKNHSALKGTEYYNQKRIGGYISCSLDFEYGLKYLVDSLEAQGKLDDTVFVITDDHYAYALQNGDAWLNDRNFLEDLFGYYPNTQLQRDHNALIIWSPCLEEMEEKIVVSDPSYAPDITPTVLNLLGADFDSRFYAGRDLLSNSSALVIWPNSCWLTDKGYYDSSTGEFTKGRFNNLTGEFIEDESIVLDDKYIEQIKTKVRNTLSLSRNMIRMNLYDTISKYIR